MPRRALPYDLFKWLYCLHETNRLCHCLDSQRTTVSANQDSCAVRGIPKLASTDVLCKKGPLKKAHLLVFPLHVYWLSLYGSQNFSLILEQLRSYLNPIPNILWMSAGQVSMGHNSINQKQCL